MKVNRTNEDEASEQTMFARSTLKLKHNSFRLTYFRLLFSITLRTFLSIRQTKLFDRIKDFKKDLCQGLFLSKKETVLKVIQWLLKNKFWSEAKNPTN